MLLNKWKEFLWTREHWTADILSGLSGYFTECKPQWLWEEICNILIEGFSGCSIFRCFSLHTLKDQAIRISIRIPFWILPSLLSSCVSHHIFQWGRDSNAVYARPSIKRNSPQQRANCQAGLWSGWDFDLIEVNPASATTAAAPLSAFQTFSPASSSSHWLHLLRFLPVCLLMEHAIEESYSQWLHSRSIRYTAKYHSKLS